jgi:hypothetical protein
MKYAISGTVMQTVAIDLAPGEQIYSQTNSMAWMNDAIRMDTHTGGGLLAAASPAAASSSPISPPREPVTSPLRRAFPAPSWPRLWCRAKR